MTNKTSLFPIIGIIIPALFLSLNFRNLWVKGNANLENHAPVVKILTPKNKSFYEWDKPLNYSVTVFDVEDGDSKFQEIESNEVLVQVKYQADSTLLPGELNDQVKDNSAGLNAMRRSNCLNCHAFNSKLIGPSFSEISKRYPLSEANTGRLKKSILEGLTGVWGQAVMPTHPELTSEETGQMVDWILKSAADSSISYYRGTEGSFRIKSTAASESKGVLIVTASYVDHGLKEQPKTNLTGQDVIMLHLK